MKFIVHYINTYIRSQFCRKLLTCIDINQQFAYTGATSPLPRPLASELCQTSVYFYAIGIEADYFRILNDRGLPYLYSPELFSIIDNTEPNNWETEYGKDGERYAYPPELNQVGFFEDYFDGMSHIVLIFKEYLKKHHRDMYPSSHRVTFS